MYINILGGHYIPQLTLEIFNDDKLNKNFKGFFFFLYICFFYIFLEKVYFQKRVCFALITKTQ
jgi:hypothetical protein